MRIGLFGGSFNPPHLGHQLVVSQVLKQGLFDQVWYVPVGNHDFGKELAPSSVRLAMLDLIQQPGTRVETYELDHPGISYTHTTLKALQKKYPQHEFSWIIGSDQLSSLDRWGCEQESACFPAVLQAFPFYVYPRTGYPMQLPYDHLIPLTEMPEIAISSTEIREKIGQKKSVRGLVDEKIQTFLAAQPLYSS